MGGAACAAKILLCGPPVAQRVSAAIYQAHDVAKMALDRPEGAAITQEHMEALQHAVCACEGLAEQVEKVLRGPLQACMNDIAVCPVAK